MGETKIKGGDARKRGVSCSPVFRRPEAGAAAGFLLILIFFSYFGWDKQFVTALGSSTWLNFASKVGIIAIPIGFLMIAGELDISIGALIPAGGIVLAMSVETFGLNAYVSKHLAGTTQHSLQDVGAV